MKSSENRVVNIFNFESVMVRVDGARNSKCILWKKFAVRKGAIKGTKNFCEQERDK